MYDYFTISKAKVLTLDLVGSKGKQCKFGQSLKNQKKVLWKGTPGYLPMN